MKESFLNINFEITHTCNQNCKYCYNNFLIDKGLASSNPFKTLKKLFSLVETKYLTFTGGEPLLSNQIEECIIHAILNNAKPIIITNGSIQNKSLINSLINLGTHHFQITLNSHNQKVHDNLSQQNGAWIKTVSNIKFIQSKGGVIIPIVILTKENVENIEKLFELFKSLGLNRVIVNRYNLSKGQYFNELTISKDLLNSTFRKINEISEKLNITITSNVCTPHCILDPNEFNNITFGSCPSNPKERPVTIDFLGNVRLCNHSPRIVGNIFKNNFNEMLFSQYSLSWTSVIPEYCNECEKYDDCKGGCRAASEQIFGSHLTVDPMIEINKVE
jgi:radical SAM protein with 4Fe4S-binding SPASM domain